MIGWDAEPVRDRALRHSVRDYVLEAIRDGKLTPGDRVHETSLARSLAVSLSPVREALFRLADQGLLEHRPRRGFYVRTLTEAGTREIYTFRALLEGFAARLAATHAVAGETQGTADDLERRRHQHVMQMESLVQEGKQAALRGDREAVAACNAQFHDQLVRLAGHALLERSWSVLAPAEWLLIPTWNWRDEPLTVEDALDWSARHQRLLDLIRAGEAEEAEREAREHVLQAGEENVRRRFPEPSSTMADKLREI